MQIFSETLGYWLQLPVMSKMLSIISVSVIWMLLYNEICEKGTIDIWNLQFVKLWLVRDCCISIWMKILVAIVIVSQYLTVTIVLVRIFICKQNAICIHSPWCKEKPDRLWKVPSSVMWCCVFQWKLCDPACCLLSLFSDPCDRDGGRIFLQNDSKLLSDYQCKTPEDSILHSLQCENFKFNETHSGLVIKR